SRTSSGSRSGYVIPPRITGGRETGTPRGDSVVRPRARAVRRCDEDPSSIRQGGRMSQTERRRPTIEDVAREARVSRATVSRVLNGATWVSEDAAVRVRSAIKKTGYRINAHARSLATRRAGSVALLLTESHERFFEDPNFSLIMRSASTALAEREFQLLLILADTTVEQRRAVDFMTAG